MPKNPFQSMSPFELPIFEFLREAPPEIAASPYRLDELWTLLEDACLMFVAMQKEGVSIGGRLPSLERTALCDILPALGTLVGADKVGLDLAAVPNSFVTLVKSYEDAVRRAEANKALELRARNQPSSVASRKHTSPFGDFPTEQLPSAPRNQFHREK